MARFPKNPVGSRTRNTIWDPYKNLPFQRHQKFPLAKPGVFHQKILKSCRYDPPVSQRNLWQLRLFLNINFSTEKNTASPALCCIAGSSHEAILLLVAPASLKRHTQRTWLKCPTTQRAWLKTSKQVEQFNVDCFDWRGLLNRRFGRTVCERQHFTFVEAWRVCESLLNESWNANGILFEHYFEHSSKWTNLLFQLLNSPSVIKKILMLRTKYLLYLVLQR